MQLPSELYEYCSKAIPFLSASFQGAPNLLHIHFHLTIPLNYLNSPSRKQSPSIISPSSAAHVEFGDLQIHLISSHSCQAAGFCGFPPCSPPACPHHSRASMLFAGARDAATFPSVPLIIAIALLAAGFTPKPHGGLVVPMWFTLPIRHQKNPSRLHCQRSSKLKIPTRAPCGVDPIPAPQVRHPQLITLKLEGLLSTARQIIEVKAVGEMQFSVT